MKSKKTKDYTIVKDDSVYIVRLESGKYAMLNGKLLKFTDETLADEWTKENYE